MNYLIFLFLAFVKAKRGVERKGGTEVSIVMSGPQGSSAYPATCGIQREAKNEILQIVVCYKIFLEHENSSCDVTVEFFVIN